MAIIPNPSAPAGWGVDTTTGKMAKLPDTTIFTTPTPQTNANASLGSVPLPSFRGATTYGDYVPTTARTGDVVMFDQRTNMQSPEVQKLIQSGFAAPYADNGLVFTKQFNAQTAFNPMNVAGLQPGQTYSSAQAAGLLGGATELPTMGPKPQPSVPYNYQVQELTPEARKQTESQLRHELSLTVGQDRIPKDLTPYINALKFGGYTTQDIANHLTEIARNGSSQIVNPTVNRWHWLVGGQYQGKGNTPMEAAGFGMGDQLSNLPNNLSQNSFLSQLNAGLGALTPPDIKEISPLKLPGYSALDRQQQDLIKAQQKANDENYQNLLKDIDSQYNDLYASTKLEGEQNFAKNRAFLARLGSLGQSTAAVGMQNGLVASKEAALTKVEADRAKALRAAYSAWQTGDFTLLDKAWNNAKDLAFKYTENLTKEWESRKESRQLGINEFQAKTNFMLGAYGKMLDLAELGLSAQELDLKTYQISEQLRLDQEKFDELKRSNGVDEAMKWADLTGYYTDPKTGKITPTLELLKSQMSGNSNGTTDISNIDTKENYTAIDVQGVKYYQKNGEKNYISEQMYANLPTRAQAIAQSTPYSKLKNLSAEDYFNVNDAYKQDGNLEETLAAAFQNAITSANEGK